MTILSYLTHHMCPACSMYLPRHPDDAHRVVCVTCWAMADYDRDRDKISNPIKGALTPQEISHLREHFDLPR